MLTWPHRCCISIPISAQKFVCQPDRLRYELQGLQRCCKLHMKDAQPYMYFSVSGFSRLVMLLPHLQLDLKNGLQT